MAGADEWLALIDDKLSPEERAKTLTETAQETAQVLAARVDAEARTLELLSRHLDEGFDTDTFQRIDDALSTYLGRAPAYMIDWLVLGEATRLDELDPYAPDEVMNFLRNVMAAYGSELRACYAAWKQHPNDWRMFYRDVYTDHINKTVLIKVRLEKFNGEEVVLEGPPSAFLSLAHNVMLTLQLVPPPLTFAPGVAEAFIDSATQLIKIIEPDEELGSTFGSPEAGSVHS